MGNTQANLSKAFEKYIADKRIVIADPSSTSRVATAHIFSTMGAKTANITLAQDYATAEAAIAQKKPHVVICEYQLEKKCGLDLLQKQRAENPDTKNALFVLLTGNTSQSAVARAAEEDVDAFIIKPYTAEQLRATVMKCAVFKISPPPYFQEIDKGKTALAQGRIDEAIGTFERAKGLDNAPSLAHFYHGQANLLKRLMTDAQGNYAKGLTFNKIHYKCLVGLYDVLMSQKKTNDAYDVIKRLSQYFPANPKRLSSVLRLAIMTKSYEDVERYYQTFINIDERNEEMIRYVCAALVVCGKYYLTTGSNSRALDLFRKAATTGAGRVKILREIILALCEAQMAKEAESYLSRFPPDTQSGVDYHALRLWVLNCTAPIEPIYVAARALVGKGIHDPLIYQVLISRSAEAGHKDAAESAAADASNRWPEMANLFASLAKTPAAKKA